MSVALGTTTFTTDSLIAVNADFVGYGIITYSFVNTGSTSTSDFRLDIVQGSTTLSSKSYTSITKGNTVSDYFLPDNDTVYSLLLYRNEFGTYSPQYNGDFLTVTRKTGLITSVSKTTTSMQVSWPRAYTDAKYTLTVTGTKEAARTFNGTYDGTSMVQVISSLTEGNTYTIQLTSNEKVDRILDSRTVTMASTTNLSAKTYCSYVDFSWTTSTDDSGTATVFKVVSTDGALTSSESSKGSVTLSNLTPGTAYAFMLYRKDSILGTWTAESEVFNTTTLTATPVVDTVTSRMVSVNWTNSYSGAKFYIKYKADGDLSYTSYNTTAYTLASNPGYTASNIQATMSGLSPGKRYQIQLLIDEGGASHALGSAFTSLAAAMPGSTPSTQNLYTVIAIVGVVILVTSTVALAQKYTKKY
jgi:hypothetical protein